MIPMNPIDLLKSAFLGLVEGITEWLPISSTGHMILVDEFVKLNVTEEFWNMFLVVIQLGAILSVCVLYFHQLNPFSPSTGKDGRRATWSLWGKIASPQQSSDCRSMTSWTSTSTTLMWLPVPLSSTVSRSS